MLRLANRTARAATAGLLGLLVAAPPPPARAEDDEGKRARPQTAREYPGDRERDDEKHDDRDGKRRDDRNERRRDDGGRNHRREEVRRAPAPRQAERDRHEHDARSERRGPPPHVVRREDHRDRHEHHDRSEWRDDHREWRQDQERREEWREHQEWSHARYVSQHGSRWHWHGDRWCPPGHRHPPGRRVGWYKPRDDWRWARYRRPVIVHSPYYCAQCSHWYGDRYAFDRHVYGYHGLPQLAFGDAVAQMMWGLVYFGL